jgi:hypothetical protein
LPIFILSAADRARLALRARNLAGLLHRHVSGNVDRRLDVMRDLPRLLYPGGWMVYSGTEMRLLNLIYIILWGRILIRVIL